MHMMGHALISVGDWSPLVRECMIALSLSNAYVLELAMDGDKRKGVSEACRIRICKRSGSWCCDRLRTGGKAACSCLSL